MTHVLRYGGDPSPIRYSSPGKVDHPHGEFHPLSNDHAGFRSADVLSAMIWHNIVYSHALKELDMSAALQIAPNNGSNHP